MNKFFLIVSREFSTRVRKKSFIILTILTPFLMAALVIVPIWLAGFKDGEQKAVAICDTTGKYINHFKNDETYRFVRVNDPDNKEYYADDTPYEAVISIRSDLSQNPKGILISSHKEVSPALLSYAESVVNEQVRRDKLSATGIKGLENIIDDVQTTINIPTVKRNAQGDSTSSNTDIAIIAGFLSMFLIYMFVMIYGSMVMQSVIEEKTNRIIELMVSSVKPFQLMMGKIVGVSLVGFTQLLIWGVMLTAILLCIGTIFGVSAVSSGQMSITPDALNGMAATTMTASPALGSESTEMLNALLNLPYAEMAVLFVLFFIGGYLLYASFFVAVGASVNEAEDASQFMMPVLLLFIFGMYAAMGSAENTDGPLAFWTSLFPLTSPIVMMVRVPFSVPLWQEILSLVLLYGTALLFIWCGSRIYRVGILMYGKKPTIKEMWKWMRYK